MSLPALLDQLDRLALLPADGKLSIRRLKPRERRDEPRPPRPLVERIARWPVRDAGSSPPSSDRNDVRRSRVRPSPAHQVGVTPTALDA